MMIFFVSQEESLVVAFCEKLAEKREGSGINGGLDATSALRWLMRIGRLWLAPS
jgi:hypothetical protein